MISKQLAKYVKSLKLKKYRKSASAFTVEGAKNVAELLLSDFTIQHLFVTEKFLQLHNDLISNSMNVIVCRPQDLELLGTFESNDAALAVAEMKQPEFALTSEPLQLVLDGVNDPGNLGTIIRIADWYGMRQIVASQDTADFYNPKVINASMGSFTRVSVHYLDLKQFLASKKYSNVYGTYLDGDDVHTIKFQAPALMVLGSESQGIHPDLAPFTTRKITIPRIGKAESLNVAVSAAILCDNFFRSKH